MTSKPKERPEKKPEPKPKRRALTATGGPVRTRGDEELGAILAGAMRATESTPQDTLTHGFHAYPARMHPAIPATLFAALEGPRVLDPFCGSGTVLVEAIVAGRRATGVDLNPLAIRIAEVKCDLRDAKSRARFAALVAEIAEKSEARVRARVDVRAPLPRHEVQWYDAHVLKELAGLREEILAVDGERDRRALEMVLSAIVVKFSRQRSDTAEEAAPKRLRKGLVTEFFVRKASELVERWAELERAAPRGTKPPHLYEADARRLGSVLGPRFAADLVVSSPPYGGTYDYVAHHARRFAWLGIDPGRLARLEVGARRRLSAAEGARRWDQEIGAVLASIASVLAPRGLAILLVGDAQIGGRRIEADEQLRRIAPSAGLEAIAAAAQPRPDWTGGPPRREHLVALTLA